MIHLRLRTEFSFRRAYGPLVDVLGRLEEIGASEAAGITDSGTWGHVQWWKACRSRGVKPLLGTEIMIVDEPEERDRQHGPVMAFIARTQAGLEAIYRLVTWSQRSAGDGGGFYYVPRAGYDEVNALSEEVVILSGVGADLNRLKKRPNVWLQMSPGNDPWNRKVSRTKGWGKVVTANNLYPRTRDRIAYEVLSGERNRRDRVSTMHIPSVDELFLELPTLTDREIEATHEIADSVSLDTLPIAKMPSANWDRNLVDWCSDGARERGVDLTPGGEYRERMDHELRLIREKGFDDYFQVIGRMVAGARERMFVGPARGSAAGSLVCYLMGITDVDPIVHGLLFERFIDVTRDDMPDIDIDFPDIKREEVISQLAEDWGEDHVGRIGTVSRYKAKSAITDVARELDVPPWETKTLREAVEERSAGDERASFVVADAMEYTEVGRELVEKFPGMRVAGTIEGHARHTGIHAAGVLVTDRPLSTFAALDRSGAYMLDKRDAEALGMLKIDCLGLRTLSVLEDCLKQIGKDPQWLVEYPLDDVEAFEVINSEAFAGIFQFEGPALQGLCREMKVREFNDIATITALARPGPLNGGGAQEFVDRRTGKAEPTPLHPSIEEITAETSGSVVYQEQVMAIVRQMGRFDWADVSGVRKAMSKSLGDEVFEGYWEKFQAGAKAQGITAREARLVWDRLRTFGAWAFNKSHSVSYGLISYWCAVLKAHHPLAFGAACLRNAKSDDQAAEVLRELSREGYVYEPVDPERSGLTWEVHDGMLIGGLTNIKGVGESKAKDILRRREEGKPLTPGLVKLLMDPVTPFDHLFEVRERFGDMFDNPEDYKIRSGGLTVIDDIREPGDYIFIARIVERQIRDANDAKAMARRDGRRIKGKTKSLSMRVADDTGEMRVIIGRYEFARWGVPIMEEMSEGDYLLIKGTLRPRWSSLFVEKWRYLEGKDAPPKEVV